MRLRKLLMAAALCAAFAATAAGTGCARLERRFAPEPKVVTVEATTAVPSAEVSGTPAEGMPTDLPLWPGSSIESSALTKAASGPVYELTLVTTDSYEDVLNGTAAGLQEAGWTLDTTDASTDTLKGASLIATKGDVSGVVTISETGEGSVRVEYVINLVE